MLLSSSKYEDDDPENLQQQLIDTQNSLEYAKEVIKLLERQRTLYRDYLTKCQCVNTISTSNQIKIDISNLDDQIESLYQDCDLSTTKTFLSVSKNDLKSSTLKLNSNDLLTPSQLDLNSSSKQILSVNTSMLGIDMKTFLSNKDRSTSNDLSLNASNSPGNKHNSKISKIKRKPSFKCNFKKCRFTCFTEKSLIKHQLEHKRKQFLSIIEPYGFTLSDNNDNIVMIKPSDNQLSQPEMKQCCFPLCNYEFPQSISSESYIEHLCRHIPSYIFYPCFNCLKMFDSRSKLSEHFDQNVACKELLNVSGDISITSSDFRFSSNNYSSLYKCKLCSNVYQSQMLLQLHYSLLHEGHDIESQESEISNETEETSSITMKGDENVEEMDLKSKIYRCTMCRETFLLQPTDSIENLIQLHIEMCHNIDKNDTNSVAYFEELLEDTACSTFSNTTIEPVEDEHQINMERSANDTQMNPSRCMSSQLENLSEQNVSMEVTIEPNQSEISTLPEKPTISTYNADLDSNVENSNNPNAGNSSGALIGEEVIIETSSNVKEFDSLLQSDSENHQNSNIEHFETNESEHTSASFAKVIKFVTENDKIQYEVLFETLNTVDSNSAQENDSTSVRSHQNGDDNGENRILNHDSDEGAFVVMDASSVVEMIKNGEFIINNNEIMEEVDSSDHDIDDILTQQNNGDNTTSFVLNSMDSTEDQGSNTRLSTTIVAVNPTCDDDEDESKGDEDPKTNTDQLKQLMNLYIYECSKCTFSFRSEKELALHNYVVHKIASFSCQQCEFVSQDIETFRRHELIHKTTSQSQLFTCVTCSESFETNADLQWHLKTKHLSYECTICNIVMPNRFTYSSHMISFHRDSVLKCEHCTYKTFNQEYFDKHKRIHTSYKTCSYENCTDSFGSDELLDAHVNKFHKMEKPHKCSHCFEAFYNIKFLNKHLVEVHKEFLYKCERCSFKSNNSRVYCMHLKCHTSDKPYKCTEKDCYATFRTRYLLDSHLLHRHSTLRAFACDWDSCGKRFKTKSQLKQHYRSHSGQLFTCDWNNCGQKFSNLTRLRCHQAIHTKPFKCPHDGCNSLFGKKIELTRHVKGCNFNTSKELSLIDSDEQRNTQPISSTIPSVSQHSTTTFTHYHPSNRSLIKSTPVTKQSTNELSNS